MTNNQDALKCAETLERDVCDLHDPRESAAHIRRLVAENERLQKLCDERGSNEAHMFLRCRELSDQVAASSAKAESATALVQQMLEALENYPSGNHSRAITAAREWLEKGGAA